MLENNRAESDFRVITKVADIPENLQKNEYSASLILIKKGKACKYIYPVEVPRKDYDLRPFAPIVRDEPNVELRNEGIIESQIINYDFKTSLTKPESNPLVLEYFEDIQSIQVISFSSVEGDSVNNEKLHNSRARYIQEHLIGRLNVSDEKFETNAQENWNMMDFQLNYFERDELSKISHDSLKSILATDDSSLPWDSLLHSQRRATAIINYQGSINDSSSNSSIGELNLRTGIVLNAPKLVNKALYSMYESSDYNPLILFEPQVVEFINSNPETVSNYSALLSFHYVIDPYSITSFIHSWLGRIEQIDSDARSNLLHLYTLVGTHLLDNWDVSSERLSNVIHPLKVEKLSPKEMKEELVLNLHLTFIDYFGQINDSPNISKSFYFIADYFKTRSLQPEDDVDLALFFNNWSMYNMAAQHLLSRFDEDQLNEDGLFLLAQTMNFTNDNDGSEKYIEVHKKALESNQERWCNWINVDFQVKRNFKIKRFYCESCN
jgi:hypothetical protein